MAAGNTADIILTDISMPVMGGIELTTNLTRLYPSVKVIVLSGLDKEEQISQAFKAGAKGYMFKSVSSDELVFAIKHVNANNEYVCSELSMRLVNYMINRQQPPINDNNQTVFTARELEVLNLISQGLTNQEIADKLFTSKRTVEGYRQAMLQKTNLTNTAALIKHAVLKGLIHD